MDEKINVELNSIFKEYNVLDYVKINYANCFQKIEKTGINEYGLDIYEYTCLIGFDLNGKDYKFRQNFLAREDTIDNLSQWNIMKQIREVLETAFLFKNIKV
jgi:hypothetical protein